MPPPSFSLHLCRSFFQLVGDLSELNEKQYDDLAEQKLDKSKFPREDSPPPTPPDSLEVELDDLEVISTLGIGGFGRVELVRVSWRHSDFFQQVFFDFQNYNSCNFNF